jgi:hypothetical protein
VLAFVALLIWMKIIIYMKYIKEYGIIFAIVQKSMLEVSKFLILWGIEILMFSSVAFLMLG